MIMGRPCGSRHTATSRHMRRRCIYYRDEIGLSNLRCLSRAKLRTKACAALADLSKHFRYLKHLGKFSLDRAARPLLFACVGGTGMVVDLTTLSLLLHIMQFGPSRALAIWLAMTSNFLLNRRFTFSHARDSGAVPQYLLFCSACLVGAIVNWTCSVVLVQATPLSAFPIVAAGAGVIAGTVFNYCAASWFVFRQGILDWRRPRRRFRTARSRH